MDRRTVLSGFAAAFAATCSHAAPLLDARETMRRVFLAPKDPALGTDHGKLISAFRVAFIPIEEGAPGINPEFPFGDKVNVMERALSLLGTKDRLLATRRLAESGRILPAYIERAQLAPGKYKVPGDMAAYFDTPGSGVGKDGRFAFSAAHASLLKGANWNVVRAENIAEVLAMPGMWPMPYIDGKRPYGDMSPRLEKLRGEMTAALQVFLTNARLPG